MQSVFTSFCEPKSFCCTAICSDGYEALVEVQSGRLLFQACRLFLKSDIHSHTRSFIISLVALSGAVNQVKSSQFYLYSAESQQKLYHDTFHTKPPNIPSWETTKSKHHGTCGKKKLPFNRKEPRTNLDSGWTVILSHIYPIAQRHTSFVNLSSCCCLL